MRMQLISLARAVRRALALSVAMVALVVVPTVVSATAIGYQYWGQITWKGITIPSGQLTHEINGSGLHINWDGANFAAVGNLCDSSMKFTYGNGAHNVNGNIHYGCSHVGQWKYKLNWNAPVGKACAELWVERWRKMVTKQCHYVHP